MKNILTIAGFDPSSGAGIIRDVDTFFSLGIHGLSAPTCTVIQGPKGVSRVYRTQTKQFKEMVDLLREELPIHGVKTGVVCDAPYIKEIADLVKEKGIPLVIDPVMTAKNGITLLSERGIKALVNLLFPLATVITPNVPEASQLCGKQIKTTEDMAEAARLIIQKGPRAVIIKGGHLKGDPIDIFYDGSKFVRWKKKRINRVVHGTGCSFSALIISFLVIGYSLKEAFFTSEGLMETMLKESYRIDKGGYFYTSTGIMNHLKLTRKTETIRP